MVLEQGKVSRPEQNGTKIRGFYIRKADPFQTSRKDPCGLVPHGESDLKLKQKTKNTGPCQLAGR